MMDFIEMTREELTEIISNAKMELEKRTKYIATYYEQKLENIMNEIKDKGFFIKLHYSLEEDCIVDYNCVYVDIYGDDEDDEDYLFENL